MNEFSIIKLYWHKRFQTEMYQEKGEIANKLL